MVIDDHLRHMRLSGLPETTVAARRQALYRLARHHRPTPLLELTEDQLLAWRESVSHLSDRTIATYVSHVSCFYGWAVQRHLITASPATWIPVPALGRCYPRPIATADLFMALDNAPQPIRLWLVLAAWCGLRCKEIALLRRDAIREHDEPPVLVVEGNATKGRRERIVPLAPFAVTEISVAGLPATGYAFRLAGSPAHKPNRVSRLTADYLHGQGIPATAHMLRHWYGTGTWHASHDLRVVQELLGHASPATTAIYADWDRPAAAAAVGALPVPGPRLRAVR